jgi:hypothetical protein
MLDALFLAGEEDGRFHGDDSTRHRMNSRSPTAQGFSGSTRTRSGASAKPTFEVGLVSGKISLPLQAARGRSPKEPPLSVSNRQGFMTLNGPIVAFLTPLPWPRYLARQPKVVLGAIAEAVPTVPVALACLLKVTKRAVLAAQFECATAFPEALSRHSCHTTVPPVWGLPASLMSRLMQKVLSLASIVQLPVLGCPARADGGLSQGILLGSLTSIVNWPGKGAASIVTSAEMAGGSSPWLARHRYRPGQETVPREGQVVTSWYPPAGHGAFVGCGDSSRMDAGLREGGGTAYCEHLLPRKAGGRSRFTESLTMRKPYGLAQEWAVALRGRDQEREPFTAARHPVSNSWRSLMSSSRLSRVLSSAKAVCSPTT